MNIDKIADRKTGRKSAGERFRDDWLTDLPEPQWPPYIDESAKLVMRDIAIGDTTLTNGDFPSETGRYYKRGLAESSGEKHTETTLPIGRVSSSDLGAVMWALNDLQWNIRSSTHTNYSSSSRAIEAVINKALIQSVGEKTLALDDFETVRLPEHASVTDLMSELFCRPRSDAFIDALVDVARQSRKSGEGLLRLLEEPQMVTPLWDHQQEALTEWLESGCRGFVDMATATGKTFLGLASIAHHFGKLHPKDADARRESRRLSTDDASVVIVAHRSVILDQWKREFDRHLNIPEDAAASDGEHTARYSWGTVRFWTPQRLIERGVPETDLVVLDEIHHYLGSSGFGSILDDIDGHLLALSGSISEENARTLKRRDIPQVGESFTLRDGQEVGIIPQCDWHVRVVPFEGQSRLAEVTEECTAGMERYQDGPSPSTLDDQYEPSDLAFDTLSEARSVIQSSAGRTVKEQDEAFRQFSAAVKSRGLTKSNLSPTLSTITSLTLEHVHDDKCVVLLETEGEIETVLTGVQRELGEDFDDLVVDIREFDDTLEGVRSFDEEYDAGALIGTASTLGEGVDIKTADVGINRSNGRLSNSLVQRIGRVLRNPDGDKLASFYHVMPIPTERDAMLPKEDGIELLETASQLVCWGESFEARPDFETAGESVESALLTLEQRGAKGIAESAPDAYTWPKSEAVRAQLEEFCDEVRRSDESALLSVEPQLGTGEPKTTSVPYITGHTDARIELSEDTWSSVLRTIDEKRGLENVALRFVENATRNRLRETDKQAREFEAVPTEDGHRLELNPVLSAVLRSTLASGETTASEFVEAAVRKELPNEDRD